MSFYIVPDHAIEAMVEDLEMMKSDQNDNHCDYCSDAIKETLENVIEGFRTEIADCKSWEIRNDEKRIAIYIERGPQDDGLGHMSAIDITGFTVNFDGYPVLKYIGKDVHYALPRLSITEPYARGGSDEIMVTFGGGLWACLGDRAKGQPPMIIYGEGTETHKAWQRNRNERRQTEWGEDQALEAIQNKDCR